MMLATTDFHRAAGYSALAAMATLIVAGVTLALFFGGAGAVFGPINDVFTALTLLLLVLPVLAIRAMVGDAGGPVFEIVSLLALAGIALAAIGQLLLVAGVISLETSFVTGGVGILPGLAWVIALAVLALGAHALPDPLGWASLVMLGFIVVATVVASVSTGAPVAVATVGLVVSLEAWLAVLALTFLQR